MQINSAGGSSVAASNTSMEVVSAKLAKNQQEQEGQAALQLLSSAAQPVPSSNPAVGQNINIAV